MGKERKVALTSEEGQGLLRVSAGFSLPERLGADGPAYNVADRALSARDAQTLYKELRSRSPLLVKDRRLCFGPGDNWRKEPSENGERWSMVDTLLEVAVALSEDASSGAYWCLLLMVHPASPIVLNAQSQADVAWPLAKKLRFVNALEKATGLDKAEHKRIDLDPDPEEGAKAETEERK